MWAAGHDNDDTISESDSDSDGDSGPPAAGDLDQTPPLMHDGIPITGYYRGEPIPDLNALPQDDWLEALRPLRPLTRKLATAQVRTAEQARQAGIIRGQLILEDPVPHARDVERALPRMPAGAAPPRGRGPQINFRLGPGEHARLLEAARLFGMRPTSLARLLTVRGVERALYEERRGT